MNYLLLSQPSESYAEALSAALWGISRPAKVRTEKDTQLYTSWVVHPESGAVALFVPDDTRPVHVDADVEPLIQAIGSALSEEEKETIRNYIESVRGGRFYFKGFLENSSLAANLRTKEELEEDGWFPVEII